MESEPSSRPGPKRRRVLPVLGAGTAAGVVMAALVLLSGPGPIAGAIQFVLYFAPLGIMAACRGASRMEQETQVASMSGLLLLVALVTATVGDRLGPLGAALAVLVPAAIVPAVAAGRLAPAGSRAFAVGPPAAEALEALATSAWYLLALGLTSSLLYAIYYRYIDQFIDFLI